MSARSVKAGGALKAGGAGLRLEARQTQTLSMTPRMVQAIKLLQMSTADLAAHVASEIERNPLLAESDAREDAPQREENAADQENAAGREDKAPDALGVDTPALEADLGTELTNVFEDEGAGPRLSARAATTGSASDADWDGGSGRAAPVSLKSRLRDQIALVVRHPVQGLVAARLLEHLEPDGYLREPLDEIAAALHVPLASVKGALARLQTLEPTGVFARDAAECLALQLKARDRFDPAMAALVANLDRVAARDWAGLRKTCGVDAEDLADMVAELRALDPRPGLRYAAPEPEPAEPDVLVSRAPGGGWAVSLNPSTLPRVLVDRRYHAQVRTGADARTKLFLDTCLDEAGWLIKSLDRRRTTILKVASEIVLRQTAFLTRGPEALRPLSLADVAEAIDVHESTVSRAVADKTMACPCGITPLRAFFGGGLESADGAGVSAEAVKARIAALISAEPRSKPLSDGALAERLSDEGIDVARRTVAKYREALKRPSSAQRRREYQLSE